MDAIKFLKSNCGFSCGDPNSEISRAWAEIEEMQRDAERYRWRKENPAIEVEVFRGRYRCTARDSVVTDWLDSYDEAIDAAMNGANTRLDDTAAAIDAARAAKAGDQHG